MKKKLFIIFIFLSFVTQTIAEPGTNPILSRLTYSDIFGVLGVLFGLNEVFKGFMSASPVSRIYHAAFILILSFFLPIFFSLNLGGTLVECMILAFLTVVSIGIYQQFKDELIQTLFPLLMYTVLTASILGFYDLIASSIGLPRLFPGRTDGEALSGFRNAGQAGAYYLVLLTILIPLKFSRLNQELKPFHKKLLNYTLIVALIFIFLTGKIAAYVGLICGVFFYLLYKRNLKAVFTVVIGIFLLAFVWNNLESIMPDTYNRVSTKYDLRVTKSLNNENDNDFVEKNYGKALQAFEDRPLIGTGIGGFYGTYDDHEVHSTYFKMIGETGLLGTLGYLIFIFVFMRLFTIRSYKKVNPYSDYLATMLPFILGCFVSWAYTYHLRKREFWILIAVVLIVNYAAKKYNPQAAEATISS